MKQFLLLPLIFLALSACNNAEKTNSSKQSSASSVVDQADESDWLTKLYAYYVEEPKIQQELDENMLIEYIAENKIPVTRTRSGLYYSIIEAGTGDLITMNDKVEAHYKGYFLDGKEFDSSYKRGQPLKFKMGQMIPGWTEGLQFLNKGSKAKFLLPSHLAYGRQGFPGYVPANTSIIFDLEILEVGPIK